MSKPEMLSLLQLLSALESWSFSAEKALPDYLLQRLDDSIDVLRKEILESGKS